MTDEEFAELGRIAEDAVNKTPVYPINQGLPLAERRVYLRKNEISRGKALVARLAKKQWTLAALPEKRIRAE